MDDIYQKVRPYLATATLNGATSFLGLYRSLVRAKKGVKTHTYTKQMEETYGEMSLQFLPDPDPTHRVWYEAEVNISLGKITFVISREKIL